MLRDSRNDYGRGGRRTGYDRHRYSSRVGRREDQSKSNSNSERGGPSGVKTSKTTRPGMPSFLRDEASKLLMKHNNELKEKRNQDVVRAKRITSASSPEEGDHTAKRRKSSPSNLDAEKDVVDTAKPQQNIPSPDAECINSSQKRPFNPYHEGVSDDDGPQASRGSEEIGLAMAMRKSKWEVEEEVEPGVEAECKPLAETGGDNDMNSSLVSDDSDDDSSLQGVTQGIDMRQSARIVDEYDYVNKISEGAYGIVSKGREKSTGRLVALKKIKMEKEKDGYPLTSLREINILSSLNHPNIVNVSEVVVSASGNSVFLVMEYLEHDLKKVSELLRHRFTVSDTKCIMQQLLSGVSYLHDNWIIHRDLKLSNILYNNKGDVKICDFGMARQYGDPRHPYTQLVVTLWYRAPELLLGTNIYSTSVDMWALGCIMGELLRGKPMFDCSNEIAQIDRIFQIVGSPTNQNWPGFRELPNVPKMKINDYKPKLHEWFPKTSFTGGPMLTENGFDLLNKLLALDPDQRISAQEALVHPWFEERPLPVSKTMLPTFG